MKYYLYHIPGKKIGVTSNLNKRVTEQQGYGPDAYEVLFTSNDIDLISDMEIELQQSYGYKVDRELYKNLNLNKMKYYGMLPTFTEMTTTFPIQMKLLAGYLKDNKGLSWSTPQGYTFEINDKTTKWLLENSNASMFNEYRTFIYNKALYEFLAKEEAEVKEKSMVNEVKEEQDIFKLIRGWASKRGLYDKGDPMTQYVKLQEEAGELAKALLKKDEPEVIDAIGDIVVVLTNLAHLKGYKIEDCIQSAYDVINKRTGKMIDGTFVKDEL